MTAKAAWNGYCYRCVITDANSKKLTSKSVKLTIKPKITSQPSDVSAYVGDSAQFSIKASGTGLTYRWQVSKDAGETWSNLSSSYTGYNKTTLSLTVKAAWNGYQYRCAVTDTNGKQAFSSVAKLMIKPKITSQPSDVSAYVGDSVQFRINASGAGLTYRWQVSKDAGETWSNVASSYTGYNKATLQLMVNAAWNGYRYRCVVKDANGKVLNSSAATLSICLQIIEHPVSTTVLEGLVATFTVSADPDNVSYQWQFQSSDSLGWVDCEEESGITGTREKTLQVVSSVSMDGQFFRCIIMDEKGNSVISNSAVLHVIGILEQPTDENVLLGNTATFSVAACGGALSYQWQVRNSNSGDWIDCTSGNGFQTAIYSFTPDLDNNGKQYRCLVNDIESELSIASQTATLHMYGISQQPESVHTAAGESVFFEVQAIGNQLSYQWRQRVSQSSDWTDCPSSLNGYNADTLHLIATTDMDGFQYCCQINSDPYTMYSCVVDLHVLAIESDPASVFTTDGTTVSFHIAASGTGLQYQWQERGSEYDEWADVTYGTGCQTEEFSLTATPELDAMEYRCQVSDIYGTVLFSGSATLRVTGIISNPNNVEAYVNDTAVFAISATGAGLSYRWQTRSNSDDSWANVSPTWGGYQSDTLSVPVTDDINESEYRCIVIDELGNQVVSKTATLLILSRILQQPADVAAASGETVSFTIFASGAGLTYQWQCSEDGGKTWTDATENGSSTTTLELTMHISFSGYLYRCIIADSNGGSLTSNSAILTLPLIAFGTCGPNAFWKLDNAGMLVIGGSGTIDNYTQNGSLIDGGTAPWQYYYGRIKRIVVQEGISSIGDYAFAANQNNSIGGIDLPSTLTEIGDYAFCYTKNLSEIILPSDLSSIGKYAFCNSGLTKISIPEGITEVPERAFDECQRLLRVIIPANVTTIGMYAFRGCNALRAVQILNPLCIFYDYNSTLGPTSSVSVFGYDHSTAKTYAQKYGYTFQAITDDDVYIGEEPPVPAAVQSPIIASGTCGFYAVWDLDESGTLSIRGKGLMDNGTPPWESYYSSIKKVVIEEGITSIGDYAFALGDSQLAQVILPSTLKQIRNYAFEYARSLRSISLPHSLTSLGQYAFFSSGLVSISIPEGITEIPDYAFEYCYNLETFNLPSGLTRIGQYAFAYSKLQSITLPGSLATIEFSAFNNCKSLLGVTLPVSVSSVGRYAFNDCTAMTFVQVLNPECVLYDYNSTLGPTSSVTIYGYSDSTAETYAHKYGYAFSLIED